MAGSRAITSFLNSLFKELGRNDQQIARAEHMIQAMPQTVEAYSPQTIARSLRNTPEGNLVGISPLEFRMMVREPGNLLNPDQVDRYYQMLQRGEPFSSMPFLAIEDVPEEFGYALGHDGRHRFRGLGRQFGQETPFPTRLERYVDYQRAPGRIESGNIASEADEDDFLNLLERPRFKEGGLTQCACMAKKAKKGKKK